MGGHIGLPTEAEALAAFLETWMPYDGETQMIRINPAGPLQHHDFVRMVRDLVLVFDTISGEAHGKNSVAERMIDVHKTCLEGIARAYHNLSQAGLTTIATTTAARRRHKC